MDKKIVKAIRRDCHRMMWPCYVLCGLWKLLDLVAPTLSAWLLGDMTDALLALDVPAIRGRLIPFLLAVFVQAVLVQLVGIWSDILLVRHGGRYFAAQVGRFLRRPLTALAGQTGATMAEHTTTDTVDYYFTQIWKFILPFLGLVYGSVLLAVLLTCGLHPLFTAAVLLLAGLPLLRTACIGRLNAELTARERTYETDRARDEETMYSARSFLRTNRLTDDTVDKFHSRFEGWYRISGARKNTVAAARVVFEYLCSYGAALGVIFAGAILVLMKKMTVGALMTGYLLLPTLTAFYQTVATELEEIKKENDKQERLTVFYGTQAQDLQEAEGPLPQACPNVSEIRLSHVGFTYPGGDRAIVEDWSGAFCVHETVRITGENGSGKTTLTSLLSGLYAPQAGTITDRQGRPLSKETLRRLVTIQEQNGALFQGTVWENLFAAEGKREQAGMLLTKLGFQKALDLKISAGGRELSPGEKQKVLITRALLRDEGFLILDEPLNHMDQPGADALLAHLRSRKKGLILISHQPIPLSPTSREVHLAAE